MASEDLVEVLNQLPEQISENLVVGGGPDDSGVFEISEDRYMVQSVDFFTPIVDEPRSYGEIAAANSVSDVYAMGGRPATALNIVGVPMEDVGEDRLVEILSGESDKVNEADAVIVGGHTVKNPEPVVGLAVTGFVEPENLVRNTTANPGDILFLSKPLGTGIVTTAHQRDGAQGRELQDTIHWMSRLNSVGADLAERKLVTTMTDITGYGLAGHAQEMLGPDVGMKLHLQNIPRLPDLAELIEAGYVPGGTKNNWEAFKDRVDLTTQAGVLPWLVADAQTSGGLLVAVDPEDADEVQELLQDKDLYSKAIGEVTDSTTIEVTG
ncbi:MAG: selenide, water dikinase SelD [bacterium]